MRDAQNALAGHMKPVGRVFDTPDLSQFHNRVSKTREIV